MLATTSSRDASLSASVLRRPCVQMEHKGSLTLACSGAPACQMRAVHCVQLHQRLCNKAPHSAGGKRAIGKNGMRAADKGYNELQGPGCEAQAVRLRLLGDSSCLVTQAAW